jgi:hypothetical protein
MSIQNLILGNLVSRGADRLLNPNRKNVAGIDKFISGGGIGQESEEKDKGPTTFGGIAKQGIMSLIAQAILGPVFGPLALTVGQNFAAKRQAQGLGLNPFGGDGPAGIVSNKAVTLDGNIVDVGSDDYYADLDARDKEFEETGDYDVYSNTAPTGPAYSGKATVGTRFDAEDDGGGSDDSSSGGGGTSSSDQGETSSDSGFSDSGSYEDFGTTYARGGLASLYR